MDVVAALLLLVLVLPATGFNLDAARPSVWRMDAENFGYFVDIRKDNDGKFSLHVASARPRVPSTGNRVDITTWFQCPVKENNDACKPDDKFTRDDPPSNDQGIPLRTSWNGNEKRIFEFGLRETGGLKVVVYGNGGDKQQLWSSETLQPGGSYGQPWCVTDLNNDGSDDLLVGEHMFNQNNTEQGRVFVHVGQQQGVFNTSIIMGQSSGGALFGSSISCIGDVDRDGFQDVAVGAPGEPEGGAVYIFRGSEAGIDPHHPQRISAADLGSKNLGIKGFGVSISKGLDVDKNNYSDLAVGASGSKHAVLLRARPVVHLHACLHASVSEISNETGSFNISYVINFTAAHDQPATDVEVVLLADSLLCAAANETPWACKPGDQLLNETITLSKNTNTSGVVLVALKRGVQLSPKPIEVKLDYKLVETPGSEPFKTKPVTDPKVPAEQLLKINHTLSCETHTCRTELRLRAELDNISRDAAEEAKTVRVKASVESAKDPAFLTTLVLEAAQRLTLVGDNKPHCHDNSTASTTHLECSVANPLTSKDGPKTLFLDLDLKNVPSSTDVLKLNVSVTSAGEEQSHSDNAQILEVRPNFRITGEALTTSKSTASQRIISSTSKWGLAVGVVGGVVLFILMAVVVFTIVKRQSIVPWKKSVFYRKIVAAESECSLSGATQELCSIENEYHDNIEEGNAQLRLRII